MKDDTRPFRVPLITKKTPKFLYFLIAFLIAVIIILAAFIFVEPKGEMETIIEDITKVETRIEKSRGEALKAMTDYTESFVGEETIFSSIDITNLTKEDREYFENRIDSESDKSKKSLLEQIYNKSQSIAKTKQELKELESRLPAPHIVQKGENHFQICLDYLEKEHGLKKEEALQFIDKDKLVESIVPGFKVWNAYSGSKFATFITRGNASVSPGEVGRIAKEKLVAEKNRAVRELNSLYYIIDTKKSLIKRDILEGVGLFKSYRLKKVPDRHFKYSIDLRIRNKVTIYASSFKLDHFDKIVLYPKFYNEGKDYRITLRKNKRAAALTILNRKGLKKGRVVIAVE